MRRLLAIGAIFVLAAGGAGCGREERPRDPRSEVTVAATSYYDAFRDGDMRRACSYVADRLEPYSVDGCNQVRQRRSLQSESIDGSAWSVRKVTLDPDGTRARVETSNDGTYSMRTVNGRWRIVAFEEA